ncbi:MAG: DNA-3-methyladenine glycosylase, partial [Spirochaetota bacterium]|nr:DNA-3-methyladenine glycosylase [Spirochaetota bacterium]
YGHDLVSDDFFIEDHQSFDDSEIIRSKRIGITHGGEWKDKEFRFHLKGNPYVSKQ